MLYVQSWSGGKDSTVSAFEHLRHNHELLLLCCVPMFNDNIPLIDKNQYSFILEKKDFFEREGAKVEILHGVSYVDFCLYRLVRGKNVGLYRGYPLPLKGKCGFMRECKKAPIKKFLDNISVPYKLDISYTVDEKRDLDNKSYSFLRELGYSSNGVFSFARSNNLLSPIYSSSSRDGCLLCPNGDCSQRYKFFNQYPGSFDLLYELQEQIYNERSDIFPLRNKHFFIEDSKFISPNGSNISFFDKVIL